jgi:predicted enzyme related to lactoylglutathione lyase
MKLIVNLDVPDLAPAIAFYTAALGLTHTRTLDDDVAELTGRSATLYLLKKPSGSAVAKGSAERRHYERHWTPVHMDFVVENVDEAAERAVAAGAKQESGLIEWRGSKCITLSDPFGHGFCVIQFDEGSYV